MRRALATSVGAVTLIAGVFAIVDSEAATEVAEFLWPVGVTVLVAVACLAGGFVLGQRRHNPEGLAEDVTPSPTRRQPPAQRADDVREPPESASTREKREAAYDAILLTSEAYINANRAYASYDEALPTSYVPEIQEAATTALRINSSSGLGSLLSYMGSVRCSTRPWQ